MSNALSPREVDSITIGTRLYALLITSDEGLRALRPTRCRDLARSMIAQAGHYWDLNSPRWVSIGDQKAMGRVEGRWTGDATISHPGRREVRHNGSTETVSNFYK